MKHSTVQVRYVLISKTADPAPCSVYPVAGQIIIWAVFAAARAIARRCVRPPPPLVNGVSVAELTPTPPPPRAPPPPPSPPSHIHTYSSPRIFAHRLVSARVLPDTYLIPSSVDRRRLCAEDRDRVVSRGPPIGVLCGQTGCRPACPPRVAMFPGQTLDILHRFDVIFFWLAASRANAVVVP